MGHVPDDQIYGLKQETFYINEFVSVTDQRIHPFEPRKGKLFVRLCVDE